MKHFIIGTAGHVDHGKTALIKAITGIDTDRLKEEKERGISIELGFASLTLPNGRTFGIVDVPGHERFIRNMVSGASGIDMVIMVIAADEGVMPQTREHLHICSLLGIKKGLVALTKVDMVTEEWRDLVKDDVHEFLKGTFLEASPVIPVSSITGAGLEELLDAFGRVASEIEGESDAGIFRLPVDRAFTMKGFGTVVTGTLISGDIKLGEEVEILPTGVTAKVRGIQIHNQSATIAEAGQRTAINLQGVEKDTIVRGDVLARPRTLKPSIRLDVCVEYLSNNNRRLKNRNLVRFHVGTNEAIGRIILLDREDVEPGAKASAQVVLESPIVAMARDRFVIRSYSPVTTIGGGMIVDPLPKKHKRNSEKVNHEIDLLHDGTDTERAAIIIERSGIEGIGISELEMRTGVHQNILKDILGTLSSKKQVVVLDVDESRIISFSIYQNLQGRILLEMRAYHERYPLKEGVSKEELRSTAGQFARPRLFNMAVRELEKRGEIVVERENIRLSGHRVDLKGELEDIRSKIAEIYMDAGLTPPSIKELMEKFAGQRSLAESVINVMLKEGSLIKINEDLYFHKEVLTRLREDYKSLLVRDGKATPASMKELTSLSRKFIIPLMEYFDITKLTIRAGDHRILREK
ncbi:MAG: selenocysteine-specific translation elongation factor [Deltaproteobacteria bacterium]|nr:MAG: selenocysteine-specific translation elongation factor [Deltaproteobacteria bacterium]